jgi:adenylate cyclase
VKRDIPFSASILALMISIIMPLATGLLALGWHAANTLESDNVGLRMSALELAVTEWLTGSLRTVAAVGQTLAQTRSFAPSTDAALDGERERQLMAVLERNPAVAATYVGYADGKFIYVARATILGSAVGAELGAPNHDAILVRKVDTIGGTRSESWSFQSADGSRTAIRSRPSDFDPRTRPWYREAMALATPIVTEPYSFGLSRAPGVSLAVPLHQGGGAVGFDFTLETLSHVVSAKKITPHSVVTVATGTGAVLAETASSDSRAGESEISAAIRREIAESGGRYGHGSEREATFGGRVYLLVVRVMSPIFSKRYVVAAAVPMGEISAASHELLWRSALAGVSAVLLAVVAALLVSLLLSRSIGRVAAKTERIRDLDFSDRAPVESRIREIRRLSGAVERMREGLEVFGRYVSKDLVREIMRHPESAGVGGTRRDLTVMFTDIEGFSRLSEGMVPELLTNRLSRYFAALGAPITANKGTIDKYIGDSIMAFWNAPAPDTDHVSNACHAALEAAEAGRRLADKWRALGRPEFRTRFGLHTGLAVIGNVGTSSHVNYTLVGAIANQASRLEGLNKVYGTEILASGEIARLTTDQFVWRHIDRVVPVGTTELLDIHEPLGTRANGRHSAFLERWNQGHSAYGEERFAEAILHFDRALELRPDDGPCHVYVQRCHKLLCDGVPADWDGVWRFDTK